LAFSSSAFYQQVDSAGRIALDQSLLQRTEINNEAYIVGRWHYFQIWNKKKYEENMNLLVPQMGILADNISR